jgi:ubiquinone/menaquinone biosynthesis C-methylase UbiE
MMPDEDRLRLRHTFNEAAGSYHHVRPDYPAEFFDELIAVAGSAPGDHLLDVACGPGQATVPLARRSFRIRIQGSPTHSQRLLTGPETKPSWG